MRLITTITSLIGIAAIAFVFAGHAFAGQRTASTAASSAFGSNQAEKVQVQSIQRMHTGGTGDLKQIRCPVAASVTACYVAN
jgi:hypothetical protein